MGALPTAQTPIIDIPHLVGIPTPEHLGHQVIIVTNGASFLHTIYTLVFYKLNSAIERGTKPDALGWNPCHWTSTLKAAIVNASRAWKYSQTRCMTFLKWQTNVSIESTVS